MKTVTGSVGLLHKGCFTWNDCQVRVKGSNVGVAIRRAVEIAMNTARRENKGPVQRISISLDVINGEATGIQRR